MRAVVVTILGLLGAAASARAQVRASELGSVAQVVDGTRITIEYSRPAVRGRVPFGGVVRWNEKWTPGANWATTLETDKDFRLAGHNIPKGKYSLWVIPRAGADWTLIVHRQARAFHTQKPDSAGELTRIPLKTRQAAPLERLTFSFPNVTPEGGVLQFHWATTSFELQFRVQPSRPITLDAGDIRKLIGTYTLNWRGTRARMEVFDQDGKLRARSDPNILPIYDAVFDLIPINQDRFSPLFYQAGKVFDQEDFIVVFDAEGAGPARAVEWHGIDDRVIARGERAN